MAERIGAKIDAQELRQRLVPGQEILVRSRRVRTQRAENVNERGEKYLDQVYDYFLAVLGGTNVQEFKKAPETPTWLVFETDSHARIRVTWEFQRECNHLPQEPLTAPQNSVVIVGNEAIASWASRSDYDTEVYRQLRELLYPPTETLPPADRIMVKPIACPSPRI